MNKKLTYILLLLTVVAIIGVPQAAANSQIKGNFTTLYGVAGTRIDSCDVCHIPGQSPTGQTLNPYGTDLQTDASFNRANPIQAMQNIEPKDSDSDTFVNIDEIHNLTFPGNATDFPPKIVSFSPATPVSNTTTPATQTFSIVVNQVVNTVTWFLDGIAQKTDTSVSASNFAATTSVPVLHNVTAVAQKTGDGSAMQKWDWNVTAVTPIGNGTISGKVTNFSSGSPISGATVTADGKTATTDNSGNYSITIAPGTYNVTASAAGYENITVTNVTVTANTTNAQDFELVPSIIIPGNGTITGKVTDAVSNSPISGATVKANGMMATTNANGNYSITVAPGTYTVTATMSGFQTGTASVVVTANNVTTQNFALMPVTAAPKLTLTLNTTMDGISTPIVNNITSAVLLDKLGNTVATATLPDSMTAQFILTGISPADYFIEVNGLAGDLLPTRIDSNASDINQSAGLRLRNSIIGDISNPTYRIKVYPAGLNSHPVVNYATGLNETIHNFVIVPGSTSRIEVRVLNTSAELSNFSTTNPNHNGLPASFQTWILDFPGAQTNHGRAYNNTDSNCSGCHGNLDTKPAAYSDITTSNGWCFKCHYGKTGPRNGFVDPAVVVVANGTIAGMVTDINTSSPIVGATVTADGKMATTDTNGNYSITIASGTYTVTASAAGYQSSTPASVTVAANATTTQNFALTKIITNETGTIAGMVTDAVSHSPIVGATVTADGKTATTDTNGNYSITIAPGTYNVTASAANYNSSTPASVTVMANATTTQNFALTKIVPTENGTIAGKVTNVSSGLPISGATVTADGKTATTDTSGNYSITIAPGTYNVTASAAGYQSSTPASVTVMANATTTQNFALTKIVAGNGTIAGTVTNASSGLPISGATVTADGKMATTDASGNYSIIIAPGTYTVTASAAGYENKTVTGVMVTANTTTTQNFALTKIVPPTENGKISGKVINVATGMGIPNVDISLVGIVGKGVGTKSIKMETTTDSTGMWMFDNLPAGRYIIIEKLPKGFIPVTGPVMNIMLAQGENSMDNDFQVKPISALMPPMQAMES